MAVKIERMYMKSDFRIKCDEHDAEFRCDAEDLQPVGLNKYGKWVFSYECPICGDRHIVAPADVTEIPIYRANVDPESDDLPINRQKKAEELMGTILEKMGDLESTVTKINKRTAHLFKKVSRNVSKTAEAALKNITE